MSKTRWWPKSRRTIRDVTIGDVVHAAFVSGDEERIAAAIELMRKTAQWWNDTHPVVEAQTLEERIEEVVNEVRERMRGRD